MEEIISLVVANGIFAVLFCGLLVYQLKDSRARESRYMQTIRTLSDKLGMISAVKTDADEIKTDVKSLCSDVAAVKRAVVKTGGKRGGAECATATA